MTVAVTRLDLSARDLRAPAARSTDAKAARRMLAIALVMEGSDRAAAARSCGMDRQTLRDWVYRYNAGGACGPVEPHGTRAHALPERRAEGGTFRDRSRGS